ncbi:hypothetical protein ACFX15_031721 [Malus domestica]|uniref:uncharacterized protein n=1 Tax=Malus domestica TaxID=3750 RepID=UPI0010AADBFC|nr:uncharacterized protein LOC103425280 [Malus domestica]
MEWLINAGEILLNPKQQVFIIYLWLLWNAPEKKYFENEVPEIKALKRTTKNYVDDINCTCTVSRRGPSLSLKNNNVWFLPDEGCFKLNVDGDVGVLNGTRGIKAVIRNEEGSLVGAIAMPAPSLISVLAIKLYAIGKGLEFAIDLGCISLIVKTNSLNAVQLVQSDGNCLAIDRVFLDRIRDLIEAHQITVSYVPREANFVAHRLACYSLQCRESSFWVESGPPWLVKSIVAESGEMVYLKCLCRDSFSLAKVFTTGLLS